MALILSLILSYFIGSIPTAYIFAKLARGIDIRKHGSGNIGATNAFRVLGPGLGISVFVIDCLKGVIPTLFVPDLFLRQGFFLDEVILRILCGTFAVLGHSLTIFLNFKGGKGMATTLGVLVALSLKLPMIGLILVLELLIWFSIFLVSRIVSLASLVTAACLPILFIGFKQPLALIMMAVTLSVFIFIRHKSNLYRLLHNQEPRLSFRKNP